MTTTLRRTRRLSTVPAPRFKSAAPIPAKPMTLADLLPPTAATRSVPQMLRELAFMLHATRAVGRRPDAPKAVAAGPFGTPRA